MRLDPKKLKIIRSKKCRQKGCIFLKYEGTWDKFLLKIYPTSSEEITTEIANRIIELVENFEGKEENEPRTMGHVNDK